VNGRGRLLAPLVAVLLLAGCGEEPWYGKEITGLMPELEFELTAENGETVSEQLFAGQPVAMYFGFTHCPDICPTTLARLTAAIRQLPDGLRQELQLAFVSVDPDRDGPRALARYTDAFSDRMVGLTGSQKQLREFTRRYRITYGYEEPDENGDYEVSHSSAIFVFDADGEPRLMLLDSLGVAEMAHDLELLLSSSST
jgi:protein SCO1/2